MVKKLFKHEFLAWLRVLPIIYGITLVVAGMHRIIQFFESDSTYYNLIFGSATFMYAVVALVSIAAPVVFGIQRFYKNLFTGEGYLTHTLPVTPANHLLVKGVTAFTFSIASFLILLLSLILVTAGDVLVELGKSIEYLFGQIPKQYVADIIFYVLEYMALLLIGVFAGHFLYYACICVGQLFRKNRILAAVGVYFGLYMISQILATVFSIMLMFLTESFVLEPIFVWISQHPVETIHLVLCSGIVLSVVLTGIFYLVCHYVIKKRLNLE